MVLDVFSKKRLQKYKNKRTFAREHMKNVRLFDKNMCNFSELLQTMPILYFLIVNSGQDGVVVGIIDMRNVETGSRELLGMQNIVDADTHPALYKGMSQLPVR